MLREHPLPRYPRFLVLDWAFELPWVSTAIRKVGGVVASPYNALRLLEDDQLVAVFPEGVKGTGKLFSERYRLQRFGRGGFVELALRTGAPIVPVAVVGSEEIYPMLGQSGLAARALRAPYFPLTPTFPWLGPLGMIPLPSKWRIEFCDPIPTEAYGPDAVERPARWCSSSPSGCGRRSSRRCTRTWWSGAGRFRLEVHALQQVRHRDGLRRHLVVALPPPSPPSPDPTSFFLPFAADESGNRL